MRLDLGVYGVLLVAGLGTAYWASQPAAEGEEERVSVFAVDPKAVSEVSYKAKEVDAVATRREDGRYWVDHTKTETPPAPPPAKGQDKPPPPPTAKVTTEHFLANEKMDDLLKSLNPLSAARVFTNVDDEQLADFGLKDKSEVFTVKADGGKTFTLILGKRSYGSRNRFAMEGEGKGRVLLVDDTPFENLERAPMRIYDRRLVAFEPADAQKAEIHAGDRTKRLAHTQRDKRGEQLWTDDEEGAQPKPSTDTWMDKVLKLRLTGYADAKEEASLKDVKPFLEIAFEKDGKPLDRMAFKKTTVDGKPVYWVMSDFTKAHAKVVPSRVEAIEKDIPQVLGAPKT